ncbi:hypothetical protein [Pseudolysinimonas sp.]|uniref:hypothetical protein n=1 Tax=Pseudolysinimonas sp. TaxID=2680009 RepID=UPI003783C8AE
MAQFVVAGVLLALSLVGILGVAVFDAAELAFSFAGAIHAFAVFPGLVLSLVLNALLMRAHRELGVSLTEKWLLGAEFALIAALLVLHFWSHSGDALGLAILVWPVVIVVAVTIAIVAGVRNASRGRVTTTAP